MDINAGNERQNVHGHDTLERDTSIKESDKGEQDKLEEILTQNTFVRHCVVEIHQVP